KLHGALHLVFRHVAIGDKAELDASEHSRHSVRALAFNKNSQIPKRLLLLIQNHHHIDCAATRKSCQKRLHRSHSRICTAQGCGAVDENVVTTTIVDFKGASSGFAQLDFHCFSHRCFLPEIMLKTSSDLRDRTECKR